MEDVVLKPIEIKLVSNFDRNGIINAWEHSRPNFARSRSSLVSVFEMDVPANEFSTLTFEVYAPIAIREVICSLRNHVVWARSSRVEDLSKWEVWDGCTETEIANAHLLKTKMDEARANAHQDDFRQHLPMSYMTNFSWQINVRDLVKFAIGLYDAGTDLTSAFLNSVFLALPEDIYSPSLRDLVSNRAFKPEKIFHQPLRFGEGAIGEFIVVEAAIPLSLRAQLIRHRAIQINDTLKNIFNRDCLSTPISNPIIVQMCMSVEFAKTLLEKRSCWIAQTDLWNSLLGKIADLIGGEFFAPPLPCSDGRCRVVPDNELRKANLDPAPPCPRAAKLEKETMTDAHRVAAFAYASNRPFTEFWNKEISDV